MSSLCYQSAGLTIEKNECIRVPVRNRALTYGNGLQLETRVHIICGTKFIEF